MADQRQFDVLRSREGEQLRDAAPLAQQPRVALAEAKAQLSALLDAVEAGEDEDVVITRRGKAVARVVREKPAGLAASGWVERLRTLHRDQPPLQGSAMQLLRELRDQEP